MDIKDVRRYRLRNLVIRKFGGKQAALAEAIGRTASYVARLFSTKPDHSRNIGENLAREIERLCGEPVGSLDQLLTPYELDIVMEPLLDSDDPTTGVLPRIRLEQVRAFDGYVEIPALDVRTAMGEGLTHLEVEPVANTLTLDSAWIGRNVSYTDPENLRVITGWGESMAPAVKHGDLLLVDTGVKEVVYDGIYVVALSTSLMIKRIQREVDGIRIVSDNPRYKEINVPADLQERVSVFGRIVFIWSGSRV